MVEDYMKPLPSPDLDTQPFWDYCKQHELRAQRCSDCGTFRWPPRGLCPQCHSWDFEWVKLPGTGRVYSFVVPHYVAVPAFLLDAPYVIAHITIDDTDDRVRLTSNVMGCPWEDVRVGMAVQVVFEDVTPEFTLPKFQPV
jgi:hypothetical protein